MRQLFSEGNRRREAHRIAVSMGVGLLVYVYEDKTEYFADWRLPRGAVRTLYFGKEQLLKGA